MLNQASGTELIFVFVSILLSMSVHEAMHAFAGHALGDTTAKEEGRLTLNPLKHIDILTTVLLPILLLLFRMQPFFAAKPVPFNPDRVKYGEWGAALIALAGPFTNLALALIGGLIARGIGLYPDNLVSTFIIIFIQVNISFFIFNLIPFPPLDGSRFLYAVAPEPVQNVMRTIESYGFTAILVFMFLLYPFLAPMVGNLASALFRIIL
jgi:Zn-dependent protease